MFLLRRFLLLLLHVLSVPNRLSFISRDNSLINDRCPCAIHCSRALRVDKPVSNYFSTSADPTILSRIKSTNISSTTEHHPDNPSPDYFFNEQMLGDDANIPSSIEATVDSTTLTSFIEISTHPIIHDRNSFITESDKPTNNTVRLLKIVETFQPTTPRLKPSSRPNRIDNEKRIGDAILNFSMVYSSVVFNHHGNVVTSPISIAWLILLTSYGACPGTRGVINIVPNLPSTTRCNLVLIESFIKKNSTIRTNGMLISYMIFLPDNVQLSEKFLRKSQVFKLHPQHINFNNSEEAAQIINNWSANQTDNNIADVVNSHQFNDETALVLISLGYFNCNWLIPFDRNRTKQMDFFVNGAYKKVWTMNQDIECYHGILPTLDASPYVELPLNVATDGDPVRMIIILPSERTTLSNIVSKLPEFTLKDLYRNSSKDIVNVSLPRFKIESKINLKDYQNELRIEIIFSNETKFKRITKSQHLIVSDFIQSSIIDVNEGSHQFNHSTSKVIEEQSSSTPRTHFHVNRSFIALIANNDRIFASVQVIDPASNLL